MDTFNTEVVDGKLRVVKTMPVQFDFTVEYLKEQRAKIVEQKEREIAQRDTELAEVDAYLAECERLEIVEAVNVKEVDTEEVTK